MRARPMPHNDYDEETRGMQTLATACLIVCLVVIGVSLLAALYFLA